MRGPCGYSSIRGHCINYDDGEVKYHHLDEGEEWERLDEEVERNKPQFVGDDYDDEGIGDDDDEEEDDYATDEYFEEDDIILLDDYEWRYNII